MSASCVYSSSQTPCGLRSLVSRPQLIRHGQVKIRSGRCCGSCLKNIDCCGSTVLIIYWSLLWITLLYLLDAQPSLLPPLLLWDLGIMRISNCGDNGKVFFKCMLMRAHYRSRYPARRVLTARRRLVTTVLQVFQKIPAAFSFWVYVWTLRSSSWSVTEERIALRKLY